MFFQVDLVPNLKVWLSTVWTNAAETASPFPSGCLWVMMRMWSMWMKIMIMPRMEMLSIMIMIMIMMMMMMILTILMIPTDPYALASASLFSSHNTCYIILHWPFLHFYRGGVLERCCRGELSGTLAMRYEMTWWNDDSRFSLYHIGQNHINEII